MARRKRIVRAERHHRGESAASRGSFAESRYRRVLVVLVALKVIGVVLIVDTLAVQSFDFPKSLYSRAMAWLLAGILGAASIRFGPRIFGRSRLHLAVGAFVAANVLEHPSSGCNPRPGLAPFAGDRLLGLRGRR